jgi:ADP-L-glycero-D-manno-heptose 6-epimerase
MIVVTGGAGFIGSNLLAALEARGVPELVVCDRLGSGDKWRNIAKRELADIVPPEDLTAFLDGNAAEVEAIFHLGAVSATTETDADLVVRQNVRLSLDLWQWCSGHGTRLIYASSAAVYGDGGQGFDDNGSCPALAGLRPLNAYGWSKLVVDRRVARLVERAGPAPPQWAGLRFFNVYGPNEYHKGGQRSVAVQVFEQAAERGCATLFKSHRPDVPDGGQRRDFVWVDDAVAVMLWLYDHPAVSGLFNVGSGKARSFADLARAVFAARGEVPRITYIDTPATIRDKYQYFTQARMDRLRAAGYDRPATELEDGIAAYVRDYLATDDPYR